MKVKKGCEEKKKGGEGERNIGRTVGGERWKKQRGLDKKIWKRGMGRKGLG